MRRLLALCALALSVAPVASAMVLDFEGLGDYAPIPNGYGGFDWSGYFWTLDAVAYDTPSGYKNGLVSGRNVAYSAWAEDVGFGPQSGTFTLNGLYLTGAWKDGLNVDIVGYRLGSVVRSTTVVVDTNGPTHVILNWGGLDWVAFYSYGGTPHGYNGAGEHFVIDDMEVNSVPAVPGPLAALPFALGLALRRRRR
ncbi:MAG: hypothetical protein WHU10_03100 [Fimbriimonadales bacterium]